MVTTLEKVVYKAHAASTGGRDGRSRTDDGQLDVALAVPREMGGNGKGLNPEQLFAAGYSACFIGAMKFVAGSQKIALSPDTHIDATVGIGPTAHGFGIEVELRIHVPGMERDQAQALVDQAHAVCPYSNATRGNIPVTLIVA